MVSTKYQGNVQDKEPVLVVHKTGRNEVYLYTISVSNQVRYSKVLSIRSQSDIEKRVNPVITSLTAIQIH